MTEKMRLQKYLALCGVASRRHSEELIAQGRVSVNGRVVTAMGILVEPGDQVAVDGVAVAPEKRLRYILYYKPAGEVTTASDEKGRATVLDRFKGEEERLYPVGRLDFDTEGLLLLTNDGALAQRLLHPSGGVQKVYLARIAGTPTPEALQRLRAGLMLPGEDRPTAPAGVRLLRQMAFGSDLMIELHEGRNRQVRRMLEAVGYKVLLLRRVQFGPLRLGDLKRGEWRDLTQEEVQRLKAL